MANLCGMFGRLALQNTRNIIQKRWYASGPPVRLGGKLKRRRKGKDHAEALSFAEKFARSPHQTKIDKMAPVNIGAVFEAKKHSMIDLRRQKRSNKNDSQLEFAARHKELILKLDEVDADWLEEYGPAHIRTIADHYGIYQDLFNGAYFVPVKPLDIAYSYNDDLVAPVYHGNELPAALAEKAPQVEYEAENDSLWTLLLTNPDGHLTDNSKEYVHWLVGNIPGNDISSGEVIQSYLQPFPPKGTGYHRYIYVLFKQTDKIDYAHYRGSENSPDLNERTFETLEFFRDYQDKLTPMAVNFFQAEWDPSVRQVFHHVLDMEEPAFEYRHPPPYHPPQETYPKREPFDRYFDRYRDKADLSEEVLKMKLANTSPYKENPKIPKYPFIHKDTKYKPTWLKKREQLTVRRVEQFKDMA